MTYACQVRHIPIKSLENLKTVITKLKYQTLLDFRDVCYFSMWLAGTECSFARLFANFLQKTAKTFAVFSVQPPPVTSSLTTQRERQTR